MRLRWSSLALASVAVISAFALLVLPFADAAGQTLLGNQTVEASTDSNTAGSAEAFPATASASGSVSTITLYVDARSSASSIRVGLYTDANGHPGTLLTSGSLTAPTAGAWNDVPVPSSSVTAGTGYWLAFLAPSGAGTVRFRDRCCGKGTTKTEVSAQTTLSGLPATWTSGKTYTDGPISAYASASSNTAPALQVSPSSLSMSGTLGGPPVTQNISIANGGGGTLSWSVSTSTPWLSFSPTSGTGAAAVTVTASPQELAAGANAGSFTVSASGASGSPTVVPVIFTLSSDTTSPEVTITAPTAGTSVSGTTTVSATAYDDVGVTDVQFKLGDANLGPDLTAAPYLTSWDTTTVANGDYTLTAVARDAAGHATTSPPVTVAVANTAGSSVVLAGDQQIEPKTDSNSSGVAEAFQTTATAAGAASKLTIYLDAGSTGTGIQAGLYADAGGHPGALLASGALSSPRAGAWNDVALGTSPQIASGSKYWIAILATSGTLKYRDRCCGGGTLSETASPRTLSSLPTSWSTGSVYRDGPLSAYVSSAGGPTSPVLAVSPASLVFNATVGGLDPAAAPLAVTNTGGGSLSFTVTSDAPWLTVAPASGAAPQTLQVSAAVGSLSAATYTGHLTTTSTGAQGSPVIIPVTFTVSPSSPPPSGSAGDWLTVDHDPARSGDAAGETTLTPDLARTLGLGWLAQLDGKITAQPLYVEGFTIGGQSRNVVIAATSGNSVYALDAVSGTALWRTNFGTQSGNCAIPGGYGVTGAPVIDRARGRVYTVSENGVLHVLSLSTGSDLTTPLAVVSAPVTNKVWGGLNLVGSMLYIATASDGCDTAPWTGQIIRVDVSGLAPVVASSFTTIPGISGSNKGGGIWGYGGVSVDPATGHVYAATSADSNETYTPYGVRLIALDAGLGLLGSFEPFHPSTFPCNGAPCDVDFGATPLVFQPAGCPTLVTAGNKNGNLYVIRAADLEGSAQPLQVLTLNPANDWLGSGGVGGVPAYWPEGRMVFVTDTGPGVPGVSAGIVGLTVNPDCTLSVAWSASLGGDTRPNSTPTVANGVVYVGAGNDGRVFAFDATSGTQLWNSGTNAKGSTFAAPIVADGALYVASWDGATGTDNGTIRAFRPGATPSTVLLGSQGVEAQADSNGVGVAEAFSTTATTSGVLSSLTVYLDQTSTATKVVAGIYANSGGHPGALLSQGSSTLLTAGAWNEISLPQTVGITAGTSYWVALLNPSGGTIRFRDRANGPCTSETSATIGLAVLPAAWTTNKTFKDCPFSVFGSS